MDRDSPISPSKPRHLSAIWIVGPILLLLAATAYGILEVHGVTDTWIGLAAGRQILTSDEFPTTDTFSYTFHGRVWYNQNWLTHVMQYWLYSRISPDAVIYATWTFGAGIFVLVLLAAYWRAHTWLGALLAASVVALGCRDFLCARPATTGFFCIAGLWALLCALEGQREKRRWWPIPLLLPLLLVWGNAHGSFVFGYGILGLYVAHWIILRLLRRRLSASGRQVAALALVIMAAFLLTVILGPFGLENFTHGQKIAGSKVFRLVAEWLPPTALGKYYPPVWRFWTILALSLTTLLGAWLLARSGRGMPASDRRGNALHTSLFDFAVVAIGLSMTFWARRFAPIYFIFGAPVFLTWTVMLLRPLAASWRRYLKPALALGAGLSAIPLAVKTGLQAHADLVQTYAKDYPGFNLLERVTRYDLTPHEALLFLRNNELSVNLLVEWSQAGLVMLHAPHAKVFMDGRAQQVYDELHYRKYDLLLIAADTPWSLMKRVLDHHDTNAVLLRRWERVENLRTALRRAPQWVPALLGADYDLFLRRGSRGLAQLGERLRSGQEWRPDSPAALASQGFVWEATAPRDPARAVACWKGALRRNLALGSLCFRPLTAALLELGRNQEAQQLLELYGQRLNQPFTRLPQTLRSELSETLAACRADVEAATTAPGSSE